MNLKFLIYNNNNRNHITLSKWVAFDRCTWTCIFPAHRRHYKKKNGG